MNKRFLLGAVATLAVGCVVVLIYNWRSDPDRLRFGPVTDQDLVEARRELFGPVPLEEKTLPPLDPATPVRLAIGSLGMVNDEQNRVVSDLILAELSGTQNLDLVDRQSLDTVLQEMSLSLSGLVRAQDAVRVGQLVRADWFLLGTGTEINSTDSIVLRIVDARTGILREAEVFPADGSPAKLAEDISGFIRHSRDNASRETTPVYFAIGTFEDLSLNNRLAQFATRLRANLTAAYQGTEIKLLEREAASTLLREVRLDLAGLTDEGADDATPRPMQSAYWLVEGQYQSLENLEEEVELVLHVKRLFARSTQLAFQGQPSESFFEEIKSGIDRVLNENRNPLFISRLSEARAQMAAGKELAGFGRYGPRASGGYQNLSEQEFARRHRNAEEAIQAFETVLLLDPGNREAKMYLAGCLQKQVIGRNDEARNYWREILEEDVADGWTRQAKDALEWSFRWDSAREKADWFNTALKQTANPNAAEFYQEQATLAEEKMIIESGSESRAMELAEKRLFDEIHFKIDPEEWSSIQPSFTTAMNNFRHAFDGDDAAAAQRLAELFPRMAEEFPEFAPHLASDALSFQVSADTPLVAEFEKRLEWCMEHPDEVSRAGHFWSSARHRGYPWLMKHEMYDLAARTLEGYLPTLKGFRYDESKVNESKVTLAYAYMRAERWKKALDIFESFEGKPVLMSNQGSWGEGWTPVLPARQAAWCREKLGLPAVTDSREFEMETNVVHLHGSSAFAAEQDRLWIAVGDHLYQLDTELNRRLAVKLPKDPATPITAIIVAPASIWIATGGEGLIEFDRTKNECRRWTVEDGLAINILSSLHLAGDILWIGYGSPRPNVVSEPGGGGIGKFDLTSRRFHSFTPTLADGTEAHKNTKGNAYQESLDKPTRRSVKALTSAPPDEIWFLTGSHPLRRFESRGEGWTGIPEVTGGSCLASDAEHLYVGQLQGSTGGTHSGPLGLEILTLRDGQWWSFPEVQGLNSRNVSVITPYGEDAWVGGMGYVALLDMEEKRVRKLAYVQTEKVDQIQVGGGYVWAQFNQHLHRAPLSALR